MVESADEKPPQTPKKRRRRASPEAVWIRGFLEFSGTDSVTRYCCANLHGVSLTRALEAIFLGDMVRSENDGTGAVCLFRHEEDDEVGVEVEVFFVASEMKLEIRGAMIVEVKREPDAA